MKTLLTFLFLLLSIPILHSEIIQVTGDQSTIQAGIDAASDNDTVLVEDGTYPENINFKGKAITVASHFLVDGDASHISNTIIDGSQPSHPDSASTVFMISGEDSTSVLYGFTITGGTGTVVKYRTISVVSEYSVAGAGVLIIDGGCKIEHNIIRNITMNVSGQVIFGGGISCLFSSNEQTDGKNIVIRNNTINNNNLVTTEDAVGGGMAIWTGNGIEGYSVKILISNNYIHHNKLKGNGAYGAGLGIGASIPAINGSYEICNNKISYNENSSTAFDHGAGFYVYFYQNGTDPNTGPLVYNNIISDNTAEREGGGIGIYAFSSLTGMDISPKPILINNTVCGNSAGTGPGLWMFGVKVVLINNIFWDVLEPDQDEIVTQSSIYYKYNNDIQGKKYAGNISADPNFADQSFALSYGSMCIGGGIKSKEIDGIMYNAPALDYYGNARPLSEGDSVDIGAIESNIGVGLKELKSGNDPAFLYPNPTHDLLTVQIAEPSFHLIEITSLNGQLLFSRKFQGHNHKIDLSFLQKGIYLITVSSRDYVRTEKIIKL